MQVNDDPILKAALDFWVKCRPASGLPTREEVDPVRIPPPLFPYLVLADVLSSEGRVQYRLVGNEMLHRWGENFAGRRSDEIFSGDYRTYMENAFALAVARCLPVFTASRFRWDVDGYLWTRRLMLPIGATVTGPVVQVLVVQTWPNSPDGGRTEPMVVVPGTAPVENAEPVLIRA